MGNSKAEANHTVFKFSIGTALALITILLYFALSISISSHFNRQKIEQQEAQAINAVLYKMELLEREDAKTLKHALQVYTQVRIDTYLTNNFELKERYKEDAQLLLNKIWYVVVKEAKENPNAITESILTDILKIISAQQIALSETKRNIPMMLWVMLVGLSASSSFFIGYSSPPQTINLFYSWLMPILISSFFFIVSEIDAPSQKLMKVAPKALLVAWDFMSDLNHQHSQYSL
ncbi:hypothetical protein O4H51_22300 [Aeromonas hydrophila]|uniref:bestrophin-like domain n=1 Tax=Aeromonas hydrophila TaxID=644 RepID=UPI0022AF13B5|nr:hypothetical protein [Aeromonas hydrophila]MCZ4335578.1 hypothetical protein [Aeromonas hydrophila]